MIEYTISMSTYQPSVSTNPNIARSWQYDANNPAAYSGEIIEHDTIIDLSKVELFGWEKCLSGEKINIFVADIALEDSFPPVPVVEFEDHFSLAYWAIRMGSDGFSLPDGGHHRSRAHYIAETPLRVVVLGLPSTNEFEYNIGFEVRNIRDIPII